MRSDKESDVGFEIYYEPSADIVEDDEELSEIARDRDYCISFVWGGSMKDCASAMIVCAVLVKFSDAVVSFEGGEPETIESLVTGANQIMNEDSPEPENPHPEKEEKEEHYSDEESIKKDFNETIEATVGAKISTIMVDEIVSNKKEIYVAFDNYNWIHAPDWQFNPDLTDDLESLKDKTVSAVYQIKSSLFCELVNGLTIEFKRMDNEVGLKSYAQLYSYAHRVGFEAHWRGPLISKPLE